MDAEVTQIPKYLVKKVGEKVLIECSQKMGHDGMFWYRQDPGLGLRLLHFSYGMGSKEKGDFPDGYSVSREKKEGFSLTLESASTSQTSMYLCASSEHTALHSHILSAQKGQVCEGSESNSGLRYTGSYHTTSCGDLKTGGHFPAEPHPGELGQESISRQVGGCPEVSLPSCALSPT